MTATCSRVAIIQILFSFLMGKASLENGIDTMSIQSVIQDEVVFFVVTDMVAIVVLIRNRNSSGNESLGSNFIEAKGRSHMSPANTKYFFDVGWQILNQTLVG